MATSLPPEAIAAALSAVHKAGTQSADPNAGGGGGPAPSQSGGAQTQTGAQTPDPAQGDPNADPNEQAVWQEFPATDPQNIEALAQQMQGADPDSLVQLLGQFMQQADADNQKLSQMHEAMLEQLMQLLGGPGGDGGQGASAPSGASPVPGGPGVGGNSSGY